MLDIAGIVVTNDGNAILRELDLAHPAAKACSLHLSYLSIPSTRQEIIEGKKCTEKNSLHSIFYLAV